MADESSAQQPTAAPAATLQAPTAVPTAPAPYGATQMAAQTTLMQQQAQAQTRQAAMQQQHNLAELNQKLNQFWLEQTEEVQHANDFKNHLLPLARIKKIMKSDEDVRMISAEAPVLFAKACEMFILELTHRAWAQTEEAKRRTLQRSDISAAIQKTDIFDFLIDIVPRDDPKKDDVRPVTGAVDQQPLQYYPLANMPNPAFGMPPQMNAAAVTDSSSAMMYPHSQPQVYASAGYASGMAYQPGIVNPQYVRMQQQMLYGPPPANYPAQYLSSAGEQQPPPS